MKQISTLRAGEAIQFNAGQAGKYLILREASQAVLLRGDNLRPVEIERGDTVDVSQFDELELHNHNTKSLYLEFQITDVEVRIKSSSTAINGALNINEIETPIVISKIQQPLDIAVNLPSVDVNIPDVQVDMPSSLEISNLPAVQKVEVNDWPNVQKVKVTDWPNVQKVELTNPTSAEAAPVLTPLSDIVLDGDKTIPANIKRKGVIAIAPITNQRPIVIAGFIPLMPGGSTTIPASNALSVSGSNGDVLNVGEVT